MAARQQKKRDLALVLKELNTRLSRPTKIKKTIFSPKKETVRYTAEEALELILDSNLSKQQYQNIRQGAVIKNCKMYPDCKEIWKCKSACRPNGISISDIIAQVPLKNLLEHTVKRIVQFQEEVIFQHMESINTNEIKADMIFSYGFDGSSGHSAYKQKFDTAGCHSDTNLFVITVVPLRLNSEDNNILWNNRTPQSVRFSRPLKVEYIKESTEHILKEKQDIDGQINKQEPITIYFSNNKKISFTLFMTLIDGKNLNILTGTKSNQTCPICGATPNDFVKVQEFKTA